MSASTTAEPKAEGETTPKKPPVVPKLSMHWKSAYTNVRGFVEVGNVVITNVDILNRCRLLAFFHGVPMTDDVVKELQSQVVLQLIDEAKYEQLATQFKITVDSSTIQDGVKERAKAMGKTPQKLTQELKKECAYDSYIQLLRSQYIASAIYMSAVPKDLLHLSQRQIEEAKKEIMTQQKETRYEIFELSFYNQRGVLAETAAQKAYENIKAASKKEPLIVAFQKEALRQTEGKDTGYGGWRLTSQLSPAARRALQNAKSGDIVLVKERQGKVCIVLLRDRQEPGFEPDSHGALRLFVVRVPYSEDMPSDVKQQTDRRLNSIYSSTTWQEAQSAAKDFHFETEVIQTTQDKVYEGFAHLPLNTWSRPLFDGKTLELCQVVWRGPPARLPQSLPNDEQIQAQKKDQIRRLKAQKIFRDTTNQWKVRYIADELIPEVARSR